MNEDQKNIINNIIYIKGFSQDNRKESSTFDELKILENENTQLFLFTPDYTSIESFSNAAKDIIELVMTKKNVTLIGNSFGGFLAMYIVAITNVKSILINPQIKPVYSQRNISAETRAYYHEILNIIKVSLELEVFTYNLVLLGLKDYVIPIQFFLDSEYLRYTTKTIIDRNEPHKFKNILNYTRDILDVVKK